MVEVLLYVHRNRSLLGTRAQCSHLNFHTAPELWYILYLDILFKIVMILERDII